MPLFKALPTGVIVGTTDTQTLTNKTLTSPTMTAPVLGVAAATSLAFSPTTGGVIGTTTNDNAGAGKVGEYAYAYLGGDTATVTFTNASPTVVTWAGHPFVINSSGIQSITGVYFTNSGGGLPTGVSASTNYYAVPIDANTFRIATSAPNAAAGTFVNTSSTGTGTHTANVLCLTSNNALKDVAALNLTAGDWEVHGTVGMVPASGTLPTRWIGWVSSSSESLPSINYLRGGYFDLNLSFPASTVQVMNIAPQRFSLSTTTPIYVGEYASFTVSTTVFGGAIFARRVR